MPYVRRNHIWKIGEAMSNIELKCGYISFYGNPAGYVMENIATVDIMFQSRELEEWLLKKGSTPIWKEGVFERISKGESLEKLKNALLKKIRIWQLRADSDFEIRFKSYDEILKKHVEPNQENYEVVYDGNLETNDLEAIYTTFNMNHPQGFRGHSLSISDVVELYDEQSSSFHYVDSFGFREIGSFIKSKDIILNMSMQ